VDRPDDAAAAARRSTTGPSWRACRPSSAAVAISSGRRARRLPAGLRYRETPVGERTVWLGNAAQTLHPVAGQGFNLALRDASRTGASAAGRACRLRRVPHCWRAMRRRGDSIVALPSASPTAWYACSACSDRWPAHARGAGLLALDLLPAARRFLARRMMFGARGW
jgi:2-octaprenyl-6-methoxyphenol hydroxylase